MSEAQSYYQSLLQQGYNVDQAKVYTQEHYPGFSPAGAPAPAPAPAAPAAQQSNSVDPMVAMMMMNQQNQQMMMQQQTMLAQSQQNQSGPIIVNNNNNNQQQQVIGFQGLRSGKDTSTGYLLWLGCFIFLCGLHRFYYNRPVSGIIYIFTFGLFGFGQLYDLLVMSELAKTA